MSLGTGYEVSKAYTRPRVSVSLLPGDRTVKLSGTEPIQGLSEVLFILLSGDFFFSCQRLNLTHGMIPN